MDSPTKYRFINVFLFIILFSLGACVLPSINPIYYQSDVIFEERLLGQWEGVQSIWTFEKGYNDAYGLTYREGENLQDYSSCTFAEFEVRLLKLNEEYYIDLFPDNFMNSENLFLQFHIRKVHSFAKVVFDENDNLSIQFPDYMKFDELLEERPGIIEHLRTKDGIILTAETHKLQEFIKEYASSEDVLSKSYELKKVKNKAN